MPNEYVSVAEIAKRAGVSRQTVYCKLDSKELTKFVKLDNGKKLVSTAAIPFFCKPKNVNRQSTDSQVDKKSDNESDKIIDLLQAQIEELKADKAQKDKEIETLHKLLDQQQQLTAHLQTRLELAEHPHQSAEDPHQSAEDPQQSAGDLEQTAEEPEQTAGEKKAPERPAPWWKRLFS